MGVLRKDMRPLRTRTLSVALVLLVLWTYAYDPAGAQQPQPLLVIVGATVTATDIGLGKLRSAFQSQPTDLGGVRLIPFNQPIGERTRQLFDKSVLGLGPDRVGAFWVDQRVRFSLVAPRAIPTPETILRVVASMRGAIGYVQMNPSQVPSGVRVLTVDGERPTATAYPLR